ncbi:hypothetical protein [Streptomyces hydrogenans]|uniref:hypothetical protein n=1 Tax=Streptomyces hydrogenans TaxID=1873719 RepID=UPI00380775EB
MRVSSALGVAAAAVATVAGGMGRGRRVPGRFPAARSTARGRLRTPTVTAAGRPGRRRRVGRSARSTVNVTSEAAEAAARSYAAPRLVPRPGPPGDDQAEDVDQDQEPGGGVLDAPAVDPAPGAPLAAPGGACGGGYEGGGGYDGGGGYEGRGGVVPPAGRGRRGRRIRSRSRRRRRGGAPEVPDPGPDPDDDEAGPPELPEDDEGGVGGVRSRPRRPRFPPPRFPDFPGFPPGGVPVLSEVAPSSGAAAA